MHSRPLRERFWEKVNKDGPVPAHRPELGPCWVWTARLNPRGYGSLSMDGKIQRAHRVSWQIANGPIPDGLDVLHACDNPACVNPAHLWLGTHQENMTDKVSKGRVPHGEHVHLAKLNADAVRDIRARAAQGESDASMAHAYGVSRGVIWQVRKRQTWKHVA